VVVADRPGLAALGPWAGRVKAVSCDEPNIARARNLGVAQATGEVVAFLDDDAAPEPTWLGRLAAPLLCGQAAAAAGWVRGPDGLSWQARAQALRADATAEPIALDAAAVTIRREPTKGEGTNMAFRRDALVALGGFDEGFRFYLDETELFWRLAQAGLAVAVVPRAEVHHGLLPSERRRADGLALSLSEVGASLAVWARRHGLPEGRLLAERAARRRALLRRMVAGRAEPGDVGRLLATLDAGWREGILRELPPLRPLGGVAAPFLPFRPGPGPRAHRLIDARPWERGARERARGLRAEGFVVTLLVLVPGVARHRAAFEADGLWVQRGGQWGPAERDEPRLVAWSQAARAARETQRLASVRDPGAAVTLPWGPSALG
jgi:GT2 family glycosyltransferase